MERGDLGPKGAKPSTYRIVKFQPTEAKTVISGGLAETQALDLLATYRSKLTQADRLKGISYSLEYDD
jgi:hypothetical protein